MIHNVKDSDTCFIIDGATRLVKNETETKSMLVQYDHNSERFTFKVPRFVDGHDLSLCNTVRVHYINVDRTKKTENRGVYTIPEADRGICPEDDNLVICSWLISNNATQLIGYLHFVIQFACVDGDDVLYSWNTAKNTSVSIIDGIDNGDALCEEKIDTLTQWEKELKANQIVDVAQTQTSDDPEGENVWTATFGDGRTKDLVVKNGSKGETGLVGSIETLQGTPLHFFVGTKAEYEALTDEEKVNVFAFLTDDTTKDDILNEIEALKEEKRWCIGGGDQVFENGLGELYLKNLFSLRGKTRADTIGFGGCLTVQLPESDLAKKSCYFTALWGSSNWEGETYITETNNVFQCFGSYYSLTVRFEFAEDGNLKFYSQLYDLANGLQSGYKVQINQINFYLQ